MPDHVFAYEHGWILIRSRHIYVGDPTNVEDLEVFPFSGMYLRRGTSGRTYTAGCGSITFPQEGKRSKLEFRDARTGVTHRIRRVRKGSVREHIVATMTRVNPTDSCSPVPQTE